MKSLFKLVVLMVVLISFASCQKSTRPNYQYFPDMYESVGYESYDEVEFLPNGMQAKLPAEGSVARGHKPFDIDGSIEGYNEAKASLKNPLDSTQIDSPRGGQLYDIYCAVCHGKKGDGKGILVSREKILGVPSFDDQGRALTEGSVYHTIHYGKNVMGSYANQLDEEERWQVVDYVMQLKSELGGSQTVKDSI
ncbi:quinol:cytochrome c oxidoreductase monoheme cytochrome subunit [Gelidibacter sediminis]|uniref:Quinol:cytochrome c oxidoreductase monoheme cytochrome subunit n=1 Tax=Gelidibacter sediminis TaxID=1608710 RepID=A0A4R7Q8A0_9FLAO|nr:cytochrome c [Gelidibacter sediminis]TDU43774.1 quinol:cytochrome c oxidoreductase monoheme cytochrome subunit [Gelidibacter sediminis]